MATVSFGQWAAAGAADSFDILWQAGTLLCRAAPVLLWRRPDHATARSRYFLDGSAIIPRRSTSMHQGRFVLYRRSPDHGRACSKRYHAVFVVGSGDAHHARRKDPASRIGFLCRYRAASARQYRNAAAVMLSTRGYREQASCWRRPTAALQTRRQVSRFRLLHLQRRLYSYSR